ncbi:hypothetical protein J5277_13580 [Rhizobium sp. 16-449-1b]|uniref:hypothetical protein n=1 Tax=Rhizobium sp. 16-449-1b TaxID=2819989 RepID=UPI001ADA814A|nr:hypothetical protein [Rhizobium sp. 16-449-1b]MBO9195136.1 hypothetical protein [Rhizobium sp. 16-449-1b]
MTQQSIFELRRLRNIEANLGTLRVVGATLPIWIIGVPLVDLFPTHGKGFASSIFAITSIFFSLAIARHVLCSWIVGPEHRFFNDARRVATFIDRTRERGYIPLRGPSELFKLKALNLSLLLIGWATLLSFLLGGYRYLIDGLSAGQPWPTYAGLIFEWGMPAAMLSCIWLAIRGSVRVVRSTDANDLPMKQPRNDPNRN